MKPTTLRTPFLWDRLLLNHSGAFWLLLMSVLVGLLGAFDFWTGPYLSFSIFYIVPVMAAAWYHRLRTSLFLAIEAAMVWLIADLSSEPHSPHLLIPIWNSLVRLGFFTIISMLVSTVRVKLSNEVLFATTDPLTGIANSRAFRERARLEVERARRYHHPLTIAFLDIDDFKTINDTRSHEAGDEVLRWIATVMAESVRATDLVARIGGDEFTVLFPEIDPQGAQVAIQHLFDRLHDRVNAASIPVSFSLGAVTWLDTPPDAMALIHAADELMYSAKKAGKHRVLHRVLPGNTEGTQRPPPRTEDDKTFAE